MSPSSGPTCGPSDTTSRRTSGASSGGIRWSHAGLLLFVLLVFRKIVIAVVAMSFVYQHKDEVSLTTIKKNDVFPGIIERMRESNNNYVFILNRHALNMTLNWLCNTKQMQGVHEQSLFVTLDDTSTNFLHQYDPALQIIPLRIKPLEDAFNYGDGRYQLLYLLRANLALSLLTENVTFWMAQQDTFWNKPLSTVELESEADIVFDRASDATVPFVAGGYYWTHPTEGSIRFFSKLADDLSWWYVP